MSKSPRNYALMLAQLALGIAVLGLVGVGYQINTMRQEDALAKRTLSEMNAKAKLPSTRHTSVDADGTTQHTLCSGSGWCVTDSVPPDEATDLPHPGKSGAIPVIDEEAVRLMLAKEKAGSR